MFDCVPNIFLSEYIDTAYAEVVIRSVNPQYWRFTNTMIVSVYLTHIFREENKISECLAPN